MMRGIITTLLLMFNIVVYSQITITGGVREKSSHKALLNISVTLSSIKDSTILAYTTTDENGKYKLTYEGNDDKLLVSIYSFEVKRQTKQIENRSQIVDFITEQESIALREVVVKAAPISQSNDTINYLVGAFKDKKDLVIGDVLKKMPGITVSQDGQISYKGYAINKFYIEGMDMLGGQYGIATNNVSADDVSTVQVLENHQPIKALKGLSPSVSAAINLKIKESRKGILTSTAMVGTGYDTGLLWKGELTGMYFGRGSQNISTYKTNNSGTDISKDFRSFYGEGGIGGMQLTGMSMPSSAPIGFERSFFNKSHAVTINHLKKLKNDAEVNFNLVYSNQNEHRHNFSRTHYILPGDSVIDITEDITGRQTINQLKGGIKYNLNKSNSYFNSKINFSGQWNNSTGEIVNTQEINQRYRNTSLAVVNVNQWVKTNKDERGFTFCSVNSFVTQPHFLSVSPGLYSYLFNDSIPYRSLTQNVRTNGFSSNNNFSLLSALMLGGVRVSPQGGVNFEYRNLKTTLDKELNDGNIIDIEDKAMRNNIKWTKLSTFIGVDFSYLQQNLKLNLSLPVNFNHIRLDNLLYLTTPYYRNKFYFNPNFSVIYNVKDNLDLSASYVFGSDSPDLSSLYTGYILTGYRSINRYENKMYDDYSNEGTVSLSYKDVFSMFFVNGSVSLRNYHSDVMYGETMNGILTLTQLNEQPNNANSISVRGELSKGFSWKGMVIKGNADWQRSRGSLLRQSVLTSYTGQSFGIGGTVTVKPLKWLNGDYSFNWNRNWSDVGSEVKYPALITMDNKLNLSMDLPIDNISLNVSYEHYYKNMSQEHKNFHLADVGITYFNGQTQYSLNWTNIFNTKRFITSSYNNTDSYYTEYYIRPMAVMMEIRFRLK